MSLEQTSVIRAAYKKRRSLADAQAAVSVRPANSSTWAPAFFSESQIRTAISSERPVMPLLDEVVQYAEDVGATFNCLLENERYVLMR